jgi:hypothetical protein
MYLVARTMQLRNNVWCRWLLSELAPPLLFGHVSSISYNVMHVCILDDVVYHYSELSALAFVLEFG